MATLRLTAVVAGIVAAAFAPAVAHALPFYGFNAIHTPCVDPPYYETSNQGSNCMNSTRFNWLRGKQSTYRMRVDKNVVDSYGWTPLDKAIERQKAAGGDVAAVLSMGPPGVHGMYGRWLLPTTDADLSRWRSWVDDAVEHLATKGVYEYEVWNEPNTHYNYNGDGVQADPVAYAKVYCAAYTGFFFAGSPGRLSWGGIFNHRRNTPKSTTNPPSVFEVTGYMFDRWIPEVKSAIRSECGAPRTDGVGFHPYLSAAQNASDDLYQWVMQSWLQEFRQVMNNNQLQGAYIMASENGWPAVYSGTNYWLGPEDDHKQKLIRFFDRCAAMKDTHYIRGCYWFPLQDSGTCRTSWAYNKEWIFTCAGLVKVDAQPRPAFWTFLNYLPAA